MIIIKWLRIKTRVGDWLEYFALNSIQKWLSYYLCFTPNIIHLGDKNILLLSLWSQLPFRYPSLDIPAKVYWFEVYLIGKNEVGQKWLIFSASDSIFDRLKIKQTIF